MVHDGRHDRSREQIQQITSGQDHDIIGDLYIVPRKHITEAGELTSINNKNIQFPISHFLFNNTLWPVYIEPSALWEPCNASR